MEIEDIIYTFNYCDDMGEPLKWTPSQLDIIKAILTREYHGKRRVHIETLTQYGKSASVAAAVTTSAATKKERWSIIGANEDKASIIMSYILQYAVDDPLIRRLLDYSGPLDRLKHERSRRKIMFKGAGGVQILTANVSNMKNMGRTLMGFGSRNVIEDDSALIPDKAHAQAIRMIGGRGDGFFVKIGNPFERNHFLRSFQSDRWAKIIVDDVKAVEEGRFTKEFIEEVREEINDPVLFGILYECKFLEEGMVDEDGWIPLFKDSDIENAMMDEIEPFGEERLGADVAAGGRYSKQQAHIHSTLLEPIPNKQKRRNSCTRPIWTDTFVAPAIFRSATPNLSLFFLSIYKSSSRRFTFLRCFENVQSAISPS